MCANVKATSSIWSNPRRENAAAVTGTNVMASTAESRPPYRPGAAVSACSAASSMSSAMGWARRRSPASLYARTMRGTGPSNTVAASVLPKGSHAGAQACKPEGASDTARAPSPAHSVQSTSPNGAPQRVQACTGSIGVMRAMQSSHTRTPGRSHPAQRVGEMASRAASRMRCRHVGTATSRCASSMGSTPRLKRSMKKPSRNPSIDGFQPGWFPLVLRRGRL